MENFEKLICEHNRYQTALANARKKISEMTEDQIKKTLSFAQGPNDISKFNSEDNLVITEICNAQAEEEVSKMTEEELNSKQKEIWDKHVKHCTAGTEQLTRYESILLLFIEKRLRDIQPKSTSDKIPEQ